MWKKLTRIIFLAVIVAHFPLPASAHAIIVRSEPSSGASVAGPELAVTLTYNVRIDAARSKLSVTEPGGAIREIAIAADAAPETLTGMLTDLVPGEYVLHWQVLASDGHITRGDVPFSVAP